MIQVLDLCWLIPPEYDSAQSLWPGAYDVGSGERHRILRLASRKRNAAPPEQLGGEYDEISQFSAPGRWTVKRDDRYAIIGPDSPVPTEFPFD